jgi:endonuclease/exonuclease/phosphatase family metal-dependent hydrolase
MPIDPSSIASYLVDVLRGRFATPAVDPVEPPVQLPALATCVEAILALQMESEDTNDQRIIRTRAACLMAALDSTELPKIEAIHAQPCEQSRTELLLQLVELLKELDPRPVSEWLRTLAATEERHEGERTTLHWALRLLASAANQRVVDEAVACGHYVSDHLPNTTCISTIAPGERAWCQPLFVTSFNCLADPLARAHGGTTNGNLSGLARFPVDDARHEALCRAVERMLTGTDGTERHLGVQRGGADVVCLQEVSRGAYAAIVRRLGDRASISPWCPKRTATPVAALQMYLAAMADDDAATARAEAWVEANRASVDALERWAATPGAPFTDLEAGAMLYPEAEWGNVTLIAAQTCFLADDRMAETAIHTDACLPDGSACCRTELTLPNGQQVVVLNAHMHMLVGDAPFMTQAQLAEGRADRFFESYRTTDRTHKLAYARMWSAPGRLAGLLARTAERNPQAHVLLTGDTNVDIGLNRPGSPQVFTFKDYQDVCAALPASARAVPVYGTGLMCGNAYGSPWPCQLDQVFCDLRPGGHVETNLGIDAADIAAAQQGNIIDRGSAVLDAGFRILKRREDFDGIRCVSCGGGSFVPARPTRPGRAISDMRSMLEELAAADALFTR